MLINSSVARSFAVAGWTHQLVAACDGQILVPEGVHSRTPSEYSELRGIRDALTRQANKTALGSGLSSRALAAAHGLDELLSLGEPRLMVLALETTELELARGPAAVPRPRRPHRRRAAAGRCLRDL